jgi:hypothetical protein
MTNTIVYAIHNFEAENEDEINFSVGEPITVLEKDEKYLDGWWQVKPKKKKINNKNLVLGGVNILTRLNNKKGRNINGETGLFPMNYTSPEKPELFTENEPEQLYPAPSFPTQHSPYMPSPHLSSRSSGSTIEEEIDHALSELQLDKKAKTETWDVEQVADWLKSVGLESVSTNFIGKKTPLLVTI